MSKKTKKALSVCVPHNPEFDMQGNLVYYEVVSIRGSLRYCPGQKVHRDDLLELIEEPDVLFDEGEETSEEEFIPEWTIVTVS